jgi:hypothetical protein
MSERRKVKVFLFLYPSVYSRGFSYLLFQPFLAVDLFFSCFCCKHFFTNFYAFSLTNQ